MYFNSRTGTLANSCTIGLVTYAGWFMEYYFEGLFSGRLSDDLRGGESNTEDNDCAGIVIQSDGSLESQYMHCDQYKAS